MPNKPSLVIKTSPLVALAAASFQQKKERRRKLAALPIEEKVEILRLLQKMTAEIAWEARGLSWNLGKRSDRE